MRAGAVAVLTLVLAASVSQAWAQPDVGSPAPDFTVSAVSGRVYTLSSMRGEVVVMLFFSSGCPHCAEEIPVLRDVLASCRSPYEVVVLAMGLGSRESDLALLESAGVDWEYVPPADAWGVADSYGVYATPTTIVVDPNGIISFRKSGRIYDPSSLCIAMGGFRRTSTFVVAGPDDSEAAALLQEEVDALQVTDRVPRAGALVLVGGPLARVSDDPTAQNENAAVRKRALSHFGVSFSKTAIGWILMRVRTVSYTHLTLPTTERV